MNEDSGILRALTARGVSFGIHCGALRWRDPQGILSSHEEQYLRTNGHQLILEVLSEATVVPSGSPTLLPLTFQQEFAIRYCGSAFYVTFAACLHGLVDTNALIKSVHALVENHGALRTHVVLTGERVWQNIAEQAEADAEVVQVSDTTLSEEETAACLKKLVAEWRTEAKSSFAVRLLQRADQVHILLVLWDHLFEDYVSSVSLFRELWSHYATACGHSIPCPPATQMRYVDYVRWQRDEYDANGQREEQYWARRLADAAVTKLSRRGEAHAVPKRAAGIRIPFGRDLSTELSRHAADAGLATCFVVVALLAMTIARWASQSKLTLLMVFAGRTQWAHLGIIGYLPSFVPLQVDLVAIDTISTLCSAVSMEFRTGIPYQRTARTIDGGRPELVRSPVIQWFPSVPESRVLPPLGWDDHALRLRVENYAVNLPVVNRGHASDFPLALTAWEAKGEITVYLSIGAELNVEGSAEQFARELLVIASRASKDFQSTVASLLQGFH